MRAEILAHLRCLREDIDVALRCDVHWIAVFLSVSDVHLRAKLGLKREQAVEKAVAIVEHAKAHGLNVRFSAEDASRASRLPPKDLQSC